MKKAEADEIALHEALTLFVRAAEQIPDNVYMGIDPGTTGALGFVCGKKLAAVIDIPIRSITLQRAIKTTAKERKAMKAAGKRVTKTKRVDREKRICNYAVTVEVLRILNPVKHKLFVILEEGQVQHRGKFGSGKNAAAGSNNTITAYRIGVNYGLWLLYLASRGWPVQEVTPLKWKAAVGLLKQDKKVSLERARKAFPKLAKTALARVSDHNRAEALLLAAYHREYSES